MDSTVINKYITTITVKNETSLTLDNDSRNKIYIAPPTKTGYKVVGIVGYSSGSSLIYPWRVYIDGDFGVINTRCTSANGQVTINPNAAFITFLYVKE